MPSATDPLPPPSPLGGPWRYPMAAVACGLTTVLTTPLHDWLEPVNAVMLFLLTVVLVAAKLGRGPAVMASFLSVGLFDFFYVPPRFSFAVSDIQYVLTFGVMLTVALVIGHLAIGMRQRADEAQQAAQRAQALQALAHRLAGALSVEQVLEHLQDFVRRQFQQQAELRLWLPTPDNALAPMPAASPDTPPPTPEMWLLARSIAQGQTPPRAHHVQGDGSPTGEAQQQVLLPLTGSTRNRGVMQVSLRPPNEGTSAPPLDPHLLRTHTDMLDAVSALAATALERLHFVDVAYQTELDVRTERLRNAILSALSHDVRTPLTTLVGMAETLRLLQPPLSDQAQEMAEALRGQALRLHDMVSKLLDMARLQSSLQGPRNHPPLRLAWQPVEEVIGASIQLLGSALGQHRVVVDLPADLPLVQIDAVLMERVFGNLLDNAAKYAPPDTDIRIAVSVPTDAPHLEVRVHNAGPGFPAERLQEVFEPFARGEAESHVPGMGLGLAICKAIVEAHGGRIAAHNPAAGGAEVRMQLPLGTPPAIEPEQP